jgi:hypothetical protein
MPFVSRKQAAFAHANPEKFGGEAGLKEWDEATDFSHLPEQKMGWMQNESNREKSAGTKGAFSGAAAKAGKSTREYVEEKKDAPGKTGKRARMALMYMSAKH